MKVNDYVRTDDGLIGKIVSEPYEYKDSIGCDIDFGDNNIYNEYEMYQSIIKSSPNIIDLIEVGDYVNGQYVYEKAPEDKRKKRQIEVDASYMIYGVEYLEEKDIESIVTKEQFESIEYKVKE